MYPVCQFERPAFVMHFVDKFAIFGGHAEGSDTRDTLCIATAMQRFRRARASGEGSKVGRRLVWGACRWIRASQCLIQALYVLSA